LKKLVFLVGIVVGFALILFFARPRVLEFLAQRQPTPAGRGEVRPDQAKTVSPPATIGKPSRNCVPLALPGESLQALRERFGKETESSRGLYALYSWNLPDCDMDVTLDATDRASEISIQFKKVPLLTPEGITLGHDTLAEFRVRLGGRILTEREDLSSGEGQWILTEVIRPTGDTLWQHGTPTPDVFASVPVTGYVLGTLPKPSSPPPRAPRTQTNDLLASGRLNSSRVQPSPSHNLSHPGISYFCLLPFAF
jgi:hypothetical protein